MPTNKLHQRYKYKEDGYGFQSQVELDFYHVLKNSGLEFQANPDTIEIMPSYKTKSGKTNLAFKYNPDFIITIGNKTVVVETKGDNDNTMLFQKGRKPMFIDKATEVRFKHKVIAWNIEHKDANTEFWVVRKRNVKAIEFYWEQDLKVKKTLRKKKLDDSNVPQFIERIKGHFKQIEMDLTGGDNVTK